MVKFLSINRLAYLSMIRNVRRGLVTRTEIIRCLDSDSWITTANIARQVDVTFQTVLYHLRNLEREDVVERNPDGKEWRFGPFKQSDLTLFLMPKRSQKKK